MSVLGDRSRVWLALALLGALAGSPAPAAAHGHRDVTLYELTEQAAFTPDGHRVATSALQGKARPGTPLCPQVLMDAVFPLLPFHIKETKRCVVNAVGQSDISLTTFGGTISGDFYLVVNTAETNLTDAAELVVMSGTFTGTIQVTDPDGLIITILGGTFTPTAVIGAPSPAALGIVPASFTGKFRLPFTVRHWAVYRKDNGRPTPVRPDERALGDPTVRVEVTFD